MEKGNSWENYIDTTDKKAARRDRKKRKRMPVTGRGVFDILKQKVKK